MSSKRNQDISIGEYYHIYNRGVLKRDIFLNFRDYSRFLFLILFLQSSQHNFEHVGREVNNFVRHRMFAIDADIITDLLHGREARLITFNLRPNHFHLIVEEVGKGGIAKYLQRIGNAYTKYFNTKYHLTGHLFQNSYRSVHIDSNDQLLYVSAYIHKHSSALNYRWSSYQDYVKENRWPGLLDSSLILDQFADRKEYRNWVVDSGAKEMNDAVGEHPMFDN